MELDKGIGEWWARGCRLVQGWKGNLTVPGCKAAVHNLTILDPYIMKWLKEKNQWARDERRFGSQEKAPLPSRAIFGHWRNFLSFRLLLKCICFWERMHTSCAAALHDDIGLRAKNTVSISFCREHFWDRQNVIPQCIICPRHLVMMNFSCQNCHAVGVNSQLSKLSSNRHTVYLVTYHCLKDLQQWPPPLNVCLSNR